MSILTTKDIAKKTAELMPNWHAKSTGKEEIDVMDDLSTVLGVWTEQPKKGTPYEDKKVQTFFHMLLELIEDRGSVLDQYYVDAKVKKESIG